jgi:hypothetical protein
MLCPLLTTLSSALLQPSELVLRDVGRVTSLVASIVWRRASINHLAGTGPNWSSHIGLLAPIRIFSCTDLLSVTFSGNGYCCLLTST